MSDTSENPDPKEHPAALLRGSKEGTMGFRDMSEAYADFIKAQAAMKNAKMNNINPHFKSKYADLVAVREATLSALEKNNLGIIQVPTMKDGRFVLVSKLVHSSGVVLEESFYPLPVDGKPQEIGSAITYARRYTWASLCGIASDEDDDANVAQASAQKQSDAQKVATDLGRKLRGAETEDALIELWEASTPALDDIKAQATVAYDALQDIYKKKMAELRNV